MKKYAAIYASNLQDLVGLMNGVTKINPHSKCLGWQQTECIGSRRLQYQAIMEEEIPETSPPSATSERVECPACLTRFSSKELRIVPPNNAPPAEATARPKERPYFQIREEGDDDPVAPATDPAPPIFDGNGDYSAP